MKQWITVGALTLAMLLTPLMEVRAEQTFSEIKINGDYDVLLSNIRFNNYLNDLNEINQKLEAAKSFYNKYTNLLNKTIKKFPSNIIAFIHHIKVQTFFDGKDMFDDDINDFKL